MWFLIVTGMALGPAGIPQTEPFQMTQEYSADFFTAKTCGKKPNGEEIFEGGKAVYGKTTSGVTVYLDEYARRFALDYCWR